MTTYIDTCYEKTQAIIDPLLGVACESIQVPISLIEACIGTLTGQSFCPNGGTDLKENCRLLTGNIALAVLHIVDNDIDHDAYLDSKPIISVNTLATESLNTYAKQCRANNDSWTTRNITSRIANFGVMLASIATRIIDVALGIIALPFALITLGKFESLNCQAIRGFESIGLIISDFALGILNTINPSTNEPGREQCGFAY